MYSVGLCNKIHYSELFPTKWSVFVFFAYMAFFVNQGKEVNTDNYRVKLLTHRCFMSVIIYNYEYRFTVEPFIVYNLIFKINKYFLTIMKIKLSKPSNV